MDIKAIAALIVSGISALSGILALALPYWRKDDSGYSGLWKACQKIGVFGLTTCFSIEDARKEHFNIESIERFYVTIFLFK